MRKTVPKSEKKRQPRPNEVLEKMRERLETEQYFLNTIITSN
jgi:hypothetical protein